MAKVRYGIVGLGQASVRGHLPAIAKIPEAEVVAVVSRTPEKREQAVRDLGVRAYGDCAGLLSDAEVDAVLIATPNWLHKEQAVAAFEAGKHVFLEKPPGITLDECDTILAARAASGKVLQVGHEMRYAPLFAALKQKLDAGLIGTVQMVALHEYRFPLLPGWRQGDGTGGVMLEKNSHFFDLFNWVTGLPPTRVIALGGNNVNTDSPLIDHCVVTVEYGADAARRGTVRATLIMCLFSEHGSQMTLDVVGNSGRLIAYSEERRLLHYTRDSAQPEEWHFPIDAEWHSGFLEQHQAFVASVLTGAPVLVDGPAARNAMRVSLAAERAVAGETAVELT